MRSIAILRLFIQDVLLLSYAFAARTAWIDFIEIINILQSCGVCANSGSVFNVPIQVNPAIIPYGVPGQPPPVSGIVVPVCAKDQPGFGISVVAPLAIVAVGIT